MIKIRIILVPILVLISISKLKSQTVDNIVSEIAEINQMQFYGQSGKYENFKNYEKLREIASIKELVKLTDHKNAAVAGYASFALVEKSYDSIQNIFIKFLNNKRTASILSGCIEDENELSVELYFDYKNDTSDSEKQKNAMLAKLDSIAIFNAKSDYLIKEALEKINPKEYNTQIEYLAFDLYNHDAILYFSKWYKNDYSEKIKVAWLNYLKKTDFKYIRYDYYYEVIEELLSLKDSEINKRIIDKLRKDKSWIYHKERFENLLLRNNINEKID